MCVYGRGSSGGARNTNELDTISIIGKRYQTKQRCKKKYIIIKDTFLIVR